MEESSISSFVNIRRLRNIKRCNNYPTIISEDVAQHSYYVTMLSWAIASEYNDNVAAHNMNYHPYDDENTMERVETCKVIMKSLCHDIPESITSDIPYNVKHFNSQINSLIKDVEINIVNEKFQGEFMQYISKYVTEAKDDFEGKFVAIADMLELAIYCSEEVQIGNRNMIPLLNKCVELLEKDNIFNALYERKFSPTFVSYYDILTDTLNNTNMDGTFAKFIIND